MKKFIEWLKDEGKLENIFPNIGQRAVPIQNPHADLGLPQPTQQPQQISLSSLADQVYDMNWHNLYDTFARQYKMNPNDPNVTKLRQALYQAATTNNMALLAPFKQNLWGQRV